MLSELSAVKKEDLSELVKAMDNKIVKMEAQRDLSRTWLHVDMDGIVHHYPALTGCSFLC